ncbi:PTS system mannose-specific transporter subunits IIBCA [Staphylococcus epidermidis 36-1]|nr:PTS system mannose-specific transporter subunits IIBCA [Staphylococcus epidermidis 36-1]
MKILAITSCPNGIAHTYMAQEKLEQAAKDMGVDIKVETQGASEQKMCSLLKKSKKLMESSLLPIDR